jgi:effector-binding domain-containing protein
MNFLKQTGMSLFRITPFLLLMLFIGACKDEKKPEIKPDAPKIVVRKDTAKLKQEQQPSRSPIINVADTFAVKYLVLYIKDSAASSERISQKLATAYGVKLADCIKKNNLKSVGPPIAWYKSSKAPFFFEAGIPVDKKPAKLPKGILIKSIGGEPALVAHFYGPYSSTFVGYEVLTEWLKDRKKMRSALPYEIYVTDPMDKNGKMLDPYKVQTDIVFPYK